MLGYVRETEVRASNVPIYIRPVDSKHERKLWVKLPDRTLAPTPEEAFNLGSALMEAAIESGYKPSTGETKVVES